MTNSAGVELLPCPFCGSKPRARSTADVGLYRISCVNDDCFGPHTTAANLEDATLQWNRRAPPPEAAGARREETLRSALENLTAAVEHMRVPQTIADAALQVTVTLGPTVKAARRVLAEPSAPHSQASEVVEAMTKSGTAALLYAQRLSEVLWEKHYKDDAPKWKPLPDLIGVLTQIDNMTTGLSRQAPQPQASEVVERDAKDFAIEFGGYLADSAEGLLAYLSTPGLADADAAADLVSGLRSAIYEFKKRRDKAVALSRQAPQPAAEAKYKDALERIALLDEADGHELTDQHALKAVAIATTALGKHPSEIHAARYAVPSAQEKA